LRLCNWSVLLWTVLHCYRVTLGNMHCILLAILSRLSRFPFPTFGTNWPFCVDVPLNNQSAKHQSINSPSVSMNVGQPPSIIFWQPSLVYGYWCSLYSIQTTINSLLCACLYPNNLTIQHKGLLLPYSYHFEQIICIRPNVLYELHLYSGLHEQAVYHSDTC